MKSPWTTLAIIAAGLFLGFGIGVLYTWIISPVAYVDTAPASLRGDFKDQYRMAIAAAFAADGNLSRARVRLALLADPDPEQVLIDQSRRASGPGGSPQSALALMALAQAIQPALGATPTPTSTATPTETVTLQPVGSASSVSGTPGSATPTPKPSRTPLNTLTPRPTTSPSPTPGAPFAVITNETICDTNLQPGILQVFVKDADGKQIPGIEIIIAWQGGQESFFTGLKPEQGNGYADYLMESGVNYNIKLAVDSETASNLGIPTCRKKDGTSYDGELLVVFQQP